MERRAGYAAPSISRDLSSGVMDGRDRRHGVTASSKTEVRFVRRRMSEPLFWIGCSSCVSRAQPFVLNGRLLSSIIARMVGTNS